ncbi:MAG: hypothetical protein M0C28_16720 [Candidatus Moduliflexus flocculans]|nr:hypothetical protein [Candidatus Moduliflexus flocculans]
MTTNANPGIGIVSDASRPSNGAPLFMPDRRRPSASTEVSLAERLAFERLLGDLSALFADLPAERVIDRDRSGRWRAWWISSDFDRSSFGEFDDRGGGADRDPVLGDASMASRRSRSAR